MRYRQRYIIPILFFVLLLVLFFNLGQWFIYSRVRSFSEDVFRDNLLAQTDLAASGFNGETVAQLQSVAFYPPDFVQVKQKLDHLKADYSYFNTRLLALDGSPIVAEDEKDTLFLGLEYDLGPFISASAGIPSVSKLTAARGLYLISAYAPIYNLRDSVVAVLGLDADYRFFESLGKFRENLVYLNIVSLIFIILFAVVFIIINRRLLSAQEALYQASALTSMGRMAATMAHEIKNPLGIIKATADRIKSKYGKNHDDPVFDFVSEEVDRLNVILAGYLDFARPAESSRKAEKTDLKILLEELLKQCRTDFARDKIEIRFETLNQSYPLLADSLGLRQAFLNLIINARETYCEGGMIDIRLNTDKENYRLEIADQGGGIKKEVRKKLFQPFATTKSKGSGLGLYVARRIIEQNGGRLTVSNNSEGGATAKIFLPIFRES
jgi:two-component system sensor histidine kinase HydH